MTGDTYVTPDFSVTRPDPGHNTSRTTARQFGQFRLAGYGLTAAPLAILTIPLLAYLPPYYAGSLGLSLSGIGLVFFFARLWDGITDPAIGIWSDMIKARGGRRKPWLLIGLPPLLIGFYFLTHPPAETDLGYLGIWLIVTYVGWTMVQIPYLAWGAELSADYRVRNRVSGWREGFTIVGIMLAAGIPILGLGDASTNLELVISLTFWVVLLSLPLFLAISLSSVPEGECFERQQVDFHAVFSSVFRNPVLARLLVAVFIYRAGWSVFDATFVLFATESLQLKFGFLPLILAQYLSSIAFCPILVRLADRFGKHVMLSISVVGGALVLGVTYLQIPMNNPVGVIALWVILGIFNAALWLMPTSMIADITDYGNWKGVPARNGLNMAAYNLVQKIALAAGIGVAFPILELAGFEVGVAGEGAHNLAALDFVTCVVPAIFLAIAAALLWNFPITEKRQAAIRRRIDRRDSRTRAEEKELKK